MRPSELIPLIRMHIDMGWPMLITGKPGAGKTECVGAATALEDDELMTVHPVTGEPTDLKGLPAVVEVKGKMEAEWYAYGAMRRMVQGPKKKGKKLVVFIDDAGQATPAMQAAYTHPILAREINGVAIHPDVVFLMASNRRQDRAAVTGILSNLGDRMVSIQELTPSAADWGEWALTHGVPPMLIAFNNMRPQYIEEYQPPKDMVKMTSPRTMYFIGRALIEMDRRKFTVGQKAAALTGMGGETFAKEYMAFEQTAMTLPDIDEIVMRPSKAPLPAADRPDIMLAIMHALSYKATPDNFDQIVKYLERVPPTYAVCCVTAATGRDRSLMQTRGYISFVTKNQKLFGGRG